MSAAGGDEATDRAGIGGARAWAAWVLASLFFFYAFLLRVSPSVMVEELMRDFAVGAAILGNLSAAYFYAYAAPQLPIGLMLDRFGPRRLMTFGAGLGGLGCIVFALGESLGVVYLGRLMIGAGAAFSWVGALTVAVHWFVPQRFAALAGGTQAFGMAGGVFGQAPTAFLVSTQGWRGASIAIGLLGLTLAVAIWIVVRDRLRPSHAGASLGQGLRIAVANPQTWLSALFGMAMVAPIVSFGGLWGVPYLTQTYGMSREEAAVITSVSFIGWGIGAPLLGTLSDRLGRRRLPMAIGAGLSAVTLALVPLAGGSPLALGLLMAISGFFGSSMVIGIALARESNPPQVSGTVLGFTNTFVVGSGGLFQPLIGYLLDRQWDGAMRAGARIYTAEAYHWGLSVLPAILAVGCLAALLSRDVVRPKP